MLHNVVSSIWNLHNENTSPHNGEGRKGNYDTSLEQVKSNLKLCAKEEQQVLASRTRFTCIDDAIRNVCPTTKSNRVILTAACRLAADPK